VSGDQKIDATLSYNHAVHRKSSKKPSIFEGTSDFVLIFTTKLSAYLAPRRPDTTTIPLSKPPEPLHSKTVWGKMDLASGCIRCTTSRRLLLWTFFHACVFLQLFQSCHISPPRAEICNIAPDRTSIAHLGPRGLPRHTTEETARATNRK